MMSPLCSGEHGDDDDCDQHDDDYGGDGDCLLIGQCQEAPLNW